MIYNFSVLPLYFSGIVSHSDHSGRGAKLLGTPTANMPLDLVMQFSTYYRQGIYFGKALINSKDSDVPIEYKCLINFSTNPTFSSENTSESSLVLSVHLLDFDLAKSLYGEELTFKLICLLREPKKFTSLDELKKVIEEDIQLARKYDHQ